MAQESEYQINNKRIAKNTFYLYLRMLMVMVVSLFTVRVVLNALGAEDYGINNVVGGFVAMFSFLTSALNSASLRFFSYYIGKNDQEKLSGYFTMSFWCFALLASIIAFIAEPLGVWFVQNKLTIPEARMDAAMTVLHISILSFVARVLLVPFNAIVIAHERMNMFAILGVIECFLKLGVAYIIRVSPYDKLITYSVLLLLMTSAIDLFYIVYDLKSFPECRIKRYWNSVVFKEIVNFSGWSLFGAISGVIRSQGINILLNMFFNPIVNAARAIAFQVNTQINQFVLNFYKAVQPQITKSYGAGDLISMHSLVYRSSRLCYFLILLLSIPVLLETDYLLTLWLKNVPQNTVLFTRLVVLTAIIDSTSYPLQTCISATGRIKLYQIITGGLLILNLPISYAFLKMGYPPEITMYVAIGVSSIAQVSRLIFVRNYVHLSFSIYINQVLLPILIVTLLSIIPPLFLHSVMDESIIRFICVVFVSLLSTCLFVWLLGMKKGEREVISKAILSKIRNR